MGCFRALVHGEGQGELPMYFGPLLRRMLYVGSSWVCCWQLLSNISVLLGSETPTSVPLVLISFPNVLPPTPFVPVSGTSSAQAAGSQHCSQPLL